MLKISVIIPVYNAERFLEKAVASALQFDEVMDILLIEDGSKDNSLEVCKKLIGKDGRVKFYQHPDKGNHGAGATRNLGLEKATGDYLAFLDADDYYLPNRFDAEREDFKNKKIEGVFGAIGVEFLSEKGKEEFNKKFNANTLTTVNYPTEGLEIFEGLLGLSPKVFGSFFHLNTLTFRKSSLRDLKFNEKLRVHQDSDFIIKLAYQIHLKTGIIDQAIAIRGVHDDNRITKIKNYSRQYNERQYLVWESLYQWANSNKIEKKYKERIYLQYKAYQLSLKKGILKYFFILMGIITTPSLLKTRYRFLYL
jgi:glycosyltransferase involved in cell wall biosynthesis